MSEGPDPADAPRVYTWEKGGTRPSAHLNDRFTDDARKLLDWRDEARKKQLAGGKTPARAAKKGKKKAPTTAAIDRRVLDMSRSIQAEAAANAWVKKTYRGRAQLEKVMERKGGTPVLDLLFRTGDGEFLLLEVKAANSQLGWTTEAVSTSGGKVVGLANEIEQVSPMWAQARIDELGRSADPADQALARELAESAKNGKLRSIMARANDLADARFGARGTTELLDEIKDYSAAYQKHWDIENRHRIPLGSEIGARSNGVVVEQGVPNSGRTPEQRAAALEAARASDEAAAAVQRAEEGVKLKRKELNAAKEAARPTRQALARTKVNLERAKTVKTVERHSAAILDLQAQLQKLQGPINQAEHALKVAETSRNQAKSAHQAAIRHQRELAGARKVEVRGIKQESAAAQAERRAAARKRGTSDAAPVRPEFGDDAAKQARDVAHGAPAGSGADDAFSARSADAAATPPASSPHPSAGTPHVGASSAAGTAGDVSRAAGEVAQGARGARVLKTGARLVRTIGGVAVKMFLPLGALDVALEVALALWDWRQREKNAEKEEWNRILTFVLSAQAPVRVKFVDRYRPSMGDYVWGEAQRLSGAPSGPHSFMSYAKRWDEDRNWRGFVYLRFEGDIIRQQAIVPPGPSSAYLNPTDGHALRYFPTKAVGVKFLTDPLTGNEKILRSSQRYKPDNAGNQFTRGDDEDDAAKLVTVDSKTIFLRITATNPYLTPFDFLIFKCRNLIADLLTIATNYFPNWDALQTANKALFFDSYLGPHLVQNLPAFNVAEIGLKASLLDFIKILRSLLDHVVRAGESPDVGLERRTEILKTLSRRAAWTAIYKCDRSYMEVDEWQTLEDRVADLQRSIERVYHNSNRNPAWRYEYRYVGLQR